MAKKQRQKLKLIYTLDILKKYSDEENPLNAAEIAKHLEEYGIEAERKSIYDDIACLEEYGCDIIKSEMGKKGWFVGDREFEVPEIYLLSDAVRSARFISAKKTRELLAKLGGMLSIYQAKRRKNAVYFSAADKCANEELYYNIDKISIAIEEQKQIILNYSSREFEKNREISKHTKQMCINPYALTWQEDHYYLIGNHIKYDNLLHLRLDRISAVEITENKARPFSEVSEYKDFFDTADYTKRLFGMYSGDLTEIELSCNKQIIEQVLDRFSENIFIKNVTENEFEFATKAALSEALVTWIINYGENLKVKKPKQLCDMVKQRALDVLKNYE